MLREQMGGRRLRFTDEQRRRLAVKGRVLGRRVLHELAGLVTPDSERRQETGVRIGHGPACSNH